MWRFPQFSMIFLIFFHVAAFHSSFLLPFQIQRSLFLFFSFFFVFFLHILPHVVSNSTQFSSFISFAWFKFIITMLILFLIFYLFSFLLFSFSSHSFLLPPSSPLILHIPVWWFPQFSLSFPGSGAPCYRTLSIPDSPVFNYRSKTNNINTFIWLQDPVK